MFKRVDRRRKRKEKEERLGLDEDQLGVFGLHHTDSSESESDSSDSTSTSSSDGVTTQSRKKRKRGASPPSYDQDEDGEPTTDEEEDEGDSDNGSHPPLTIASALKEPVRPHPDSDSWVCAFCPGKALKHAAMVKVHEASRIHQQRFKRMQELAMKYSPDEDIQNVLAKSATDAQPKADSETLSLRAQKRIAKQAKLKERRKKIKEKKAIARANADAKKATKSVEPNADTSDHIGGENHAPKRSKVASKDPPAKNHETSVRVQAKERRILTDAGRREVAKAPVSKKSKTGRRMGEQTTPTH